MSQLDIDIANTILSQLGGNRFIAMTGVKRHLLLAIKNGLQVKLPTRFAQKGINCVQIILDPSDTYTMKFIKLKKIKFDYSSEVISEVNGVYWDQLQAVFTEETGLNTHL